MPPKRMPPPDTPVKQSATATRLQAKRDYDQHPELVSLLATLLDIPVGAALHDIETGTDKDHRHWKKMAENAERKGQQGKIQWPDKEIKAIASEQQHIIELERQTRQARLEKQTATQQLEALQASALATRNTQVNPAAPVPHATQATQAAGDNGASHEMMQKLEQQLAAALAGQRDAENELEQRGWYRHSGSSLIALSRASRAWQRTLLL